MSELFQDFTAEQIFFTLCFCATQANVFFMIYMHFVTYYSPPHNHSPHFTASAGALTVYLPWMCMLHITFVVNTMFVIVFSEKYAVLEGVVSGRSGGSEPCTGAGLPLGGASCHTLLSTWIIRSSDSRVQLTGVGAPRDSCKVRVAFWMSTQADTRRPKELWAFWSKTPVYPWRIGWTWSQMCRTKVKGPINNSPTSVVNTAYT